MIQKITLITAHKRQVLDVKSQENKTVINCFDSVQNNIIFDIEIEFNLDIVSFRNHDYTWVNVRQNRIANEFSPKIIQLENGYLVQANITTGIWETDKSSPRKLFWRFNPEFSKPLTVYTGDHNAKGITQANSLLYFKSLPTLLFSNVNAIEISASKIPFSAIACFTDHCDFDTAKNLEVQRNFFKEKNIKITKGFFLHHFSKRGDNASFENDKAEIQSWKDDGHELCYHSLSQSIKSFGESFSDFKNFTPPFLNIPVWIDHGYQPYNLSLFQNKGWPASEYESMLVQKDIRVLWNYIDSGTTTTGVINQLNPNHFTLSTFLRGTKNLGTIKLWQATIKNIVFHYLNNEKTISQYKATAQNFKKIVYQKQFTIIPVFVRDFTRLFYSIASVILTWKSAKNSPYKISRYTPLFFKHTIHKESFVIFQTLEMIDFSSSLSQENIDLLIKEKGIFIAHTYFSDSIQYHNGKLLTDNGEINTKAAANFQYLSDKIKEQKIWNPTLSELYHYLEQLEKIVFDVDENGSIFVTNNTAIVSRKVV